MATFGIDLGTTYSCIAVVDDAGRPVVVKNTIGEDTTPSVVYFENPEHYTVGREAKNVAKISPELTVSLIKRHMGEKLTMDFHGTEHTPQSISALILKDIAESTAQMMDEPVNDVVITVPAYFGVAQRQATRNAGEIAGLNVVDVVPEPVAAALHYEAVTAGTDSTILVYDLGGGTFDTTVIKLSGDEVTVLCTDGDHHLGGADWDDKISAYLLERFLAEHPDSAAEEDEQFLQELTAAGEDLKKALSKMTTRRHHLRFAAEVTQVELSRETFQQLTAPLLERTFEITARTIELARERGAEHFDEVLLVGGSTRMPAVAEGLRARFGFEPKMHDPDLAVAKGAALFGLIQSVRIALPDDGSGGASAGNGAAAEQRVSAAADRLGIAPEQVRKLAGKKVVTVSPRAFGVKAMRAESDEFFVDHVIRANDPLPASPPTRQYSTRYADQTAIRIEVWEQGGSRESELVEDNEQIGEGVISGLPPLPQGSPIDVSFQMDGNGSLQVHAVELRTGKDLNMRIVIDGLSDDEVVAARDTVSRYTSGG